MKSDVYKEINQDKIQSYLNQGFIQKQIDIPLGDILCSLNTIIWTYKNLMEPKHWEMAADFVKMHMLGLSKQQEDPGNHEYLYRRVRVYIQKDKYRIDGLKWRMPLPPPEKIDEYADIVSELALHCIEVCVEELKEEAKKMEHVQSKLIIKNPEDTPKSEEKHKSNSIKALTFFKRLERLKSADDTWQESYSREKENINHDEIASHKKRKRTPTSHFNPDEPPLKKSVTWAKTVIGGNTNGVEYRNVKRKNNNEESIGESKSHTLT